MHCGNDWQPFPLALVTGCAAPLSEEELVCAQAPDSHAEQVHFDEEPHAAELASRCSADCNALADDSDSPAPDLAGCRSPGCSRTVV